jgi:amino acid transporter
MATTRWMQTDGFLYQILLGLHVSAWSIFKSRWNVTFTLSYPTFNSHFTRYFGRKSVRPFINNLYWRFNGFDQASHYSTTVPTKTLRNGITGSLLLVSSAYLVPILVVTGATNIDQDEWNAGSFATAGSEIGGRWLGNWIVFSAGVSFLAQFFSEMAADSIGIQGLAERGHIPSLFRDQSPHDTPTVSMTCRN